MKICFSYISFGIHAGENIELTLNFELDMLEMLGYGLDFENEIDKTIN